MADGSVAADSLRWTLKIGSRATIFGRQQPVARPMATSHRLVAQDGAPRKLDAKPAVPVSFGRATEKIDGRQSLPTS
jgi:hypothetical protein